MAVSSALRFLDALSAPSSGLVNELKFVGSELLADQATTLLDTCALPDTEFPLGLINSIYFDNSRRSYLAEKVDGDNVKQKVRIRWYGREGKPGDGEIPAFIEVKGRLGSARNKSRVSVPVSERWINEVALDDPTLVAFLYNHADRLDTPFPLSLEPVLCISYERRRYTCPQTGSRIAIDRRIRAERINGAHFPSVSGAQLNQMVCEFKNVGKRLPEWSELLFSAGLRLRSFSKFGELMNSILSGGAPV